jgi:hypothetical protein
MPIELRLTALRFPGMEGLAERMAAGVAAWRELLIAMAPEGWLVPLSYTMRETAEMLRMYHEHGPEAVEARLIDDFRELSAEEAVSQLKHLQAVTAWMPTLAMAARAHDRGDWPLAIPIWLMATEDVVRQHEIGVASPYSIKDPQSQKARLARERLAPKGSIAPPAAEALLTVFAGLSRSSSDPAVFSRNTVIHGVRPHVGGERDSIQCFFALDLVASLVCRQKGRSVISV